MNRYLTWSTSWSIVLTILLSAVAAVLVGIFVTYAWTTQLPLLQDKSPIFAVIFAPILVMALLLFVRAELGFTILALGTTVIIASAGMQLDTGDIRTSALEFVIFGSTLVLVLRTIVFDTPPRWSSLVLNRPLKWFAVLTVPALLVALFRGVSFLNMLWELKGYFLYPCFAYVLVAAVTTQTRWKLVAAVALAGGLVVAVNGIVSWFSGTAAEIVNTGTTIFSRTGGGFGTINQYGFYLSTLAFVALGLAFSAKARLYTLLFFVVAGILILGMSLSGSRGAWGGFFIGLIVFIALQPKRILFWVPILVLAAALLVWQVPLIQARVIYEAGSDAQRTNYLLTGLEAFKQYPLLGAGWGAGFWLPQYGVLQETGGLPFLHNDYLNLLVQVGLVGIAPFLWMWWTILRYGAATVRSARTGAIAGLVAGILAALVAILVEAATDHVFWNPEIAGQVWWLVGMLLAGAALFHSPHETSRGS